MLPKSASAMGTAKLRIIIDSTSCKAAIPIPPILPRSIQEKIFRGGIPVSPTTFPVITNSTHSVEVPALNIFEEKGGKDGGDEEENENSYVESYSDSTIWSAVKAIDSKTDRKLDFGQIKLCVLGEDILKDREMTKQAIDAIERNKDIWRKVIVCFTKGKAEDILKG